MQDFSVTFRYAIQRECTLEWRVKRDRIDYNNLVFILKGKALYKIDDNEQVLTENQVLFIPAGSLREAERFAGIVVTNYLHRPHFPYYWDSLMPGGVLIMETFTEANMMIWEHPRNPDHYLTEGELIRLAPADARVVAYEEGLTPADTCVARIVLMKHAPAECYAAPLEAGLGI